MLLQSQSIDNKEEVINLIRRFGGGGGAVSGDLPLIVNYHVFQAPFGEIAAYPIQWDQIVDSQPDTTDTFYDPDSRMQNGVITIDSAGVYRILLQITDRDNQVSSVLFINDIQVARSTQATSSGLNGGVNAVISWVDELQVGDTIKTQGQTLGPSSPYQAFVYIEQKTAVTQVDQTIVSPPETLFNHALINVSADGNYNASEVETVIPMLSARYNVGMSISVGDGLTLNTNPGLYNINVTIMMKPQSMMISGGGTDKRLEMMLKKKLSGAGTFNTIGGAIITDYDRNAANEGDSLITFNFSVTEPLEIGDSIKTYFIYNDAELVGETDDF